MAQTYVRQRDTAKLIQACWKRIRSRPTAERMHALCRLTWLTVSRKGIANNTGAVVAPAISAVIGTDVESTSRVLLRVKLLKMGEKKAFADLVGKPVGIVNFRPTYRNSSLKWIRKHRSKVAKALQLCAEAKNDQDRRQAYRLIEQLEGVPTPSGTLPCRAANLITPVLACLDKKERCPIINGRPAVKKRLKQLRVSTASLTDQFDALFGVIDANGLEGAFELDKLGTVLKVLIPRKDEPMDVASLLADKDDSDITVIQKTLTRTQKRLHHTMTSRLRKICNQASVKVTEGNRRIGMYDAMLVDFPDAGHHVMLEVKTSDDIPVCRMAIGQILDYQRRSEDRKNIDLVVLFPKRPSQEARQLLRFARIDIAWFVNNFSAVDGDIEL